MIDVIANASGYLSGRQDNVYQYQKQAPQHGIDVERGFSTTVSLSTNTPYITVIFRNLHYEGADIPVQTTFNFYDFKLERA
jgi:hypothetical protein